MPTPVLRTAALLTGLFGMPAGHEGPPAPGDAPTPRVVAASSGVATPPAGGALPAEFAGEIARIEALHRAALRGPVEQWHLGPVRAGYEALLKRATDPTAVAALRARLDRVRSQEEAARAARAVQTILDRSRRRDEEVAKIRRRLAEAEQPRRRPFVARGLIQPSSREVNGRRVYALIGADGNPVAYLDVPPGLDARPALSKLVGVRGSVRYNDALGARLIAVRDLEPLE